MTRQDRRDLTGRPLWDRRARLEKIVAGSELVFPVRLALNGEAMRIVARALATGEEMNRR
jgi:ATP-dependent DNA ligase